MDTWGELGRKALEELSVLPVDSPFATAAQERSTMAKFKDIIDEFVVQGFIIPGFERQTLTAAAPVKTAYELGPGRDIPTTTVPIRMKDVTYNSATLTTPYPLDEVSFSTYQERQWPRTYQGLYPCEFYYELHGNFATLYLDTSPTVGDELELTWPRFLLPDGPLDPTTEAVIPLGWGRFLYLALAADLLNVYRTDAQRARNIQMKAAAARDTIVDNNHRANRNKVDPMFQTPRRSMMSTMRGSWR